MESILQQLYYGSLDPQGERSCPLRWDPLYTRLVAQAPELETKFKTLRSEINRAYIADTEAMFYEGFSLAIKLLAEGLAY